MKYLTLKGEGLTVIKLSEVKRFVLEGNGIWLYDNIAVGALACDSCIFKDHNEAKSKFELLCKFLVSDEKMFLMHD